MLVATHQPIFLPWSGFFFKAMSVDCMVLLDSVQFPLGRGWMSRNRIKSNRGELWLTVPVSRSGRGLQPVCDVEIVYDRDWPSKHLKGIEQNYLNAPCFSEHFKEIETIYKRYPNLIATLNIELIRYLWEAFSVSSKLVLQSEIGVTGRGVDLIADICRALGAEEYLALSVARSRLDIALLERRGIALRFLQYRPMVYPQFWGDFLSNLSAIDLLMNCGPKSREIIMGD